MFSEPKYYIHYLIGCDIHSQTWIIYGGRDILVQEPDSELIVLQMEMKGTL
jgi:hypothetical protein